MRCLMAAPDYFKINIFIKQVDFGIRKSATWKGFCQKLVEALLDCSNMGGISAWIVSSLTFRKILLFEFSVTWKQKDNIAQKFKKKMYTQLRHHTLLSFLSAHVSAFAMEYSL